MNQESPQAPHVQQIELGSEAFRVTITTPMVACMAQYGPRFDTLGAVTQVTIHGKPFLAREGLIDEFNIDAAVPPPGYAEAQPGQPFVKIGVGELIRSDDGDYSFSKPYAVKRLAPVTCEKRGNSLVLSQSLQSETGWSYTYTKTYSIDPAKRMLVTAYSLRNTGTQPLVFEQYNHNWFGFGSAPVDENYSVETRFPVAERPADWFDRAGLRLRISRTIEKPAYFPSEAGGSQSENRMVIENTASGQSMVVTGDFDVARFALYADPLSLCPEVFGKFTVAAGKSKDWQRICIFCVFSSGG